MTCSISARVGSWARSSSRRTSGPVHAVEAPVRRNANILVSKPPLTGVGASAKARPGSPSCRLMHSIRRPLENEASGATTSSPPSAALSRRGALSAARHDRERRLEHRERPRHVFLGVGE